MKNKLSKITYLLSLIAIPVLVFADDLSDVGVLGALGMHLMLSLHSMGFLCLPASMIFAKDKASENKVFWRVFLGRSATVLVLACINPSISIGLDVASIFIGGFIGFPLSGIISGIRGKKSVTAKSNLISNITPAELKCIKCGAVLTPGNAFCTGCGQKVPVPLASATTTKSNVLTLPSGSEGKAFGAAKIFGYNMTEDQMVETIIKSEIDKSGQTSNVSIAGVEKRKNVFAIIYAIILMICVSLYFFHSNTALLITILLIVTITYLCISKNYNLMKYLKKEVKSRPDEKIGYIVSTVLEGKVSGGSGKIFRLGTLLVAIAVPLFIFKEPHVIYEQDSTLDGYVIRFYTIGWLNNDTILEIPAEYKGEAVVGIRGDVFANVHTLEKVVLPDTIKEIRGGAFKNASNLEEINLPDGIPEIKGETFQDCKSLKEITIPDSVTRIGGHAFRSNSSLAKVNISPNSKLKEIGSSAFRDCYSLNEIYLPRDVQIDERSFKGSGTDVKEYTEDGIVLEDLYEYDTFIFIYEGESTEVNEYRTDAKVQNASVKLEEVLGSSGNYRYSLSLTMDGSTKIYELSKNKSYIKISEDIAIAITDSYVFNTYSNRVAFNVYYN